MRTIIILISTVCFFFTCKTLHTRSDCKRTEMVINEILLNESNYRNLKYFIDSATNTLILDRYLIGIDEKVIFKKVFLDKTLFDSSKIVLVDIDKFIANPQFKFSKQYVRKFSNLIHLNKNKWIIADFSNNGVEEYGSTYNVYMTGCKIDSITIIDAYYRIVEP